jgi:RNA polymerase sigma-70 factor (ECF subfamily)
MGSLNFESYTRKDWEAKMSLVKQGDKRAFAEIFHFFSPRLKHFTFKQLHNEQVALEMVQETMAAVWNKAQLFDGSKSSLSTWIFTIARNQCFDHLRKHKGREVAIDSDDLWAYYSEPEMIEHYAPEHDRLKQQVVEHLKVLPEAQRQVVQAVFLDEMPHQAVADMLDIPVGTVKSRIRLAVEKLKIQLDSESL